jgi:hypothetical protein
MGCDDGLIFLYFGGKMKESNLPLHNVYIGYAFSTDLGTRFIRSVAVGWLAFIIHTREFWGQISARELKILIEILP